MSKWSFRRGFATDEPIIFAVASGNRTPPADAEAMQRLLVRATLTVIPGAGHLSNLEQPAAFSRALADFLLERL